MSISSRLKSLHTSTLFNITGSKVEAQVHNSQIATQHSSAYPLGGQIFGKNSRKRIFIRLLTSLLPCICKIKEAICVALPRIGTEILLLEYVACHKGKTSQ